MSSRLVSTALLLLAIASAAAAQTTTRFEGRLVREDTGAPVVGATLSIVGVSGSVRTDEDGRFIWAPLRQYRSR